MWPQWTTSDPFNCDDGDFHCYTSELCIPYNWKCDGYRDCEDGSDEYDCFSNVTSTIYPNTCDWDSFVCDNGQCIPKNWECDFYEDCSDGSDEHCSSSTLMPYTTQDPGCGFLRVPCGPGATPHCVWQWFVCDGEADRSDEAHCGTEEPGWLTTSVMISVMKMDVNLCSQLKRQPSAEWVSSSIHIPDIVSTNLSNVMEITTASKLKMKPTALVDIRYKGWKLELVLISNQL